MLEKDLQLTDIFDIDVLQRLQDAFYNTTGIAGGFSDANGVAVTQHSTHGAFCGELTKGSPEGLARCQKCDKCGIDMAIEKKGPVIYTCHAGLLDFAAPIIVDGKVLGCLMGGQVAEAPLDMDKIREYATEIGVDPDAYVEAASQVKVKPRERIEHAADFFYTVSDMMSHMAHNRYNVVCESTEIEREAHMKSDFLANMSHEIRTPMNAVIGMAEMALREELPPAAREYIHQIKNAGNSLLTLINDILDFSKIESGKMDINLADYEPASLIHDVTSIIMTRIGKKNLELIIDFDPSIPKKLMGDSSRIRQVIINLANNAVKFTNEGKVHVTISHEMRSPQEIMLKVAVKDTGIGIKKEDLGKLFQSFQQVDSKRNRNIEGSGLGLAISKQLVALMNGHIHVESEYNVGSVFSFEIPQILLDDSASVQVSDASSIFACVLSENPYLTEALEHEITRLGASFALLSREEDLETIEEAAKQQSADTIYLFVDHPVFHEKSQEFLRNHPDINGVLMIEFETTIEYNISNLLVVKKPLYSLNIGAIFNQEDVHWKFDRSEEEEFDFTAPEASVLVVDDNQVNLTVAAGLMEPLEMQIDTALSGKEAIEMITVKHYDIVFMDHMMPELDGVETTHIIRRFHEEYNNVPIIALTANAVEEMRSMFLCEGMNDFIAKPIELPTLIAALKRWLPPEKLNIIKPKENDQGGKEDDMENLPDITGLDMEVAMKYIGTRELLWKVLEDYYRVIPQKAEAIQEYAQAKDFDAYTIEVHALKSASRQIGAISLSEQAARLEQAGKDQNEPLIEAETGVMLQTYLRYQEILAPYFPEKEPEVKVKASSHDILCLLEQLQISVDNLDMDEMEQIGKGLEKLQLDEKQDALCQQLVQAVSMMDVDTCETLITQWKELL
jgi:signal transduction histidine kinase/CheY-like chemotaxis protein/HPt (histidine-containing phosphotransfer) domain-containing protein